MITNNQILASLPNVLVTDEQGNTISLRVTTISTASANLGNVNTLQIYGGNAGEALTTNGNGTLSWTPFVTPQQASTLAPIAYVDQVLTNISNVLLAGIATETFVANAIANIPPVDFTGYATETFVANTAANLVTTSTYQTYVDATANTIANLATSANLQSLSDSTANLLANKVETMVYDEFVSDMGNTVANLVTTTAYQTYVDNTANTIANLATISYVDTTVSNAVANIIDGAPQALDTLNELANALGNDSSYSTTIVNSLANKVEFTTFQTYVDDTANTIANLVTTDTFTQYQGDVSNALANTASWQELEDGLANKVYSNVFNDTVANLVGTTTFNDTVANLATITYVDNSIANIPSTDLSAYSTTTEVNGLISTALSGQGNIVTVNLTGNTSHILAGDGTWIDRVSISSANAVSITVSANGAGQSFTNSELQHYTGGVKPMLFRNGVLLDSAEYTIVADTITFTNNLTVGDNLDLLPTQIASTGGGGNVDLTGYATETFVTSAIANIPQPNLSSYATHQDVTDAINLIPSPNLDAYATNVSVDNKIANIPQPNLSAYATNTSVDNKIANITHPTYGNVANLNLNGNAATFLSGNGSWQAVSGGGGGSTPPAGSSTQIQFNNAGAFGASANLVFTDNGIILGNPIPANRINLDKFGSIAARNVNARDGMTASHAEIGEITVNRLLAVLTDGAPASSSDTGLKGEVRYDTQFMYLCVDDNTWARWALNTTW